MKLDRRSLVAGAAVVAAGAGAYLVFGRGPQSAGPNASVVGEAKAADVDPTKLLEASTLGDRVLGPADAKVTLVEYASATCPHCAEFHAKVFPTLKAEYIDTGKIRFIFREFPLDDLALAAFMLARCAPPEKYYPMIDVLFEQQKSWVTENPKADLFKIAQLAGFTEQTFNTCLNDTKVAKGVIEIKERGEKDFGVRATPTFFVNGKLIEGTQPIEEYRKAIEDALKT